MENRDFIVTSSQPWEIEIGSTIINTSLEISKQNRVLFINTPMDLASRIRDRKNPTAAYLRRMEVIKGKVSPIRRINNNLYVLDCPFTLLSVNKFPAGIFDFFNKFNNRRIARWVNKQIRIIGLKDHILLIDTDIFKSQYLKEYLQPAISIYYRRDYVIGFPYWRKHGPRLEQSLVRKSDIVLANSSYFAEELKPLNANIYPINTGVNLELYDSEQQHPLPVDMQDIPSPVVGYTGAIIESRLDSDLLYHVASKLPEYNFVFVGPEDAHFKHHPLHQLSNTHFLGQKDMKELPRYIRHFDVCINPQKLNPITIGNYPLKVDEYLAMGKPVVATSTHTMRDVFARHTHLAETPSEWISALKTAIGEAGNKELQTARIAFAHTHSWGHSVNTIYQAIKKYENCNF